MFRWWLCKLRNMRLEKRKISLRESERKTNHNNKRIKIFWEISFATIIVSVGPLISKYFLVHFIVSAIAVVAALEIFHSHQLLDRYRQWRRRKWRMRSTSSDLNNNHPKLLQRKSSDKKNTKFSIISNATKRRAGLFSMTSPKGMTSKVTETYVWQL